MPPPPASGNLNSHAVHTELSDWSSAHMSVMRVIVLHPSRKFEVSKPSRSEDVADHGVERPGDLDL